MSKTTRKELFEEFKKTGEFSCPFCLRTDYECLEDLAQHIEIDHQYEIQETEEGLSKVAKENKEVLENWVTERKREVLEKAYDENPSLFELYIKDDMALEKAVRDSIWKESLKYHNLSSFDAKQMDSLVYRGSCPDGYSLVEVEGRKMCIPQSVLNAYNQYKAEKYDYKEAHKPQSGQSTGQTEEFFESPDAMISTTQRTNTRENLSEEDRHRKELLLVLTALMRKRKSN